jgi:sugar lactone lactonase YvrE
MLRPADLHGLRQLRQHPAVAPAQSVLRRLALCAGAGVVACACSGHAESAPTCSGVCAPSAWSSLALLAGQPGGPGWVDGTLGAAHFSDPWSVRGDGKGHLYVADKNMIREVDLAAGTVRTLAGSYAGLGFSDGVGAAATFNLPSGLAVDGDTLYLTDTENHTIRAIDLPTATVSTFAGTAQGPGDSDGPARQASFREPEGLTFDASGYLYVADTDNNTIRAVDLGSGQVSTVAGAAGIAGSADGVGAAARFSKPKDLAMDGAGNVLVVDALNESIRKLVPATGQVSTLATFSALPQGLGVDGSDVMATLTDHTLVRIAPSGTTTTVAGLSGTPGFIDGPASAARFNSPAGLWNDGAGTLYVADDGNAVLRAVALSGPTVRTFAGANSAGSADGAAAAARFAGPLGLATDGTTAYVADTGNDVIRAIDLASGKVTTVAGAVGQAAPTDGALSAARFNGPVGLALDRGAQRLYVADAGNRSIRSVDLAAGRVTTLALVAAASDSFDGFDAPTGLALDGGKLYVSDFMDDVVVVVDVATSSVATFAGQYGTPGYADAAGVAAAFYGPEGLATDGHGTLFVADNLGETLRRIDLATASVLTLAGRAMGPGSTDGSGSAAQFDGPVGVAANALGDVFVSDSLDDTVRRVKAATGSVTTVLGTVSVPGVRLGPLPGQLTHPSAIALTPTGALLIVSENSVLIAR